ncbi:MAG TPA: hypothetical protein VMU55_07905 [Solirubrobacteraceae bacterium]|nr:hypothetical protein [Solirubrobacteraceae bacterium]
MAAPGSSVLFGVVAGGPTGVVLGACLVPPFDGAWLGSAQAGVLIRASADAASRVFLTII